MSDPSTSPMKPFLPDVGLILVNNELNGVKGEEQEVRGGLLYVWKTFAHFGFEFRSRAEAALCDRTGWPPADHAATSRLPKSLGRTKVSQGTGGAAGLRREPERRSR